MKKLLLTLAAGVLILALPVIASAASLGSNIFDLTPGHSLRNPQSIRSAAVGGNAFDEYSGYTAHITVHGFKSYSTSAGKNAVMKPFSWTEKADRSFTGPKNTVAEMTTVSGGSETGEVRVLLNAHTVMVIIITNAIAPANGKAIRANALYEIGHVTGAITLNSDGNPKTPTSVGLTGAEDIMEGACTITASNNTTTHNLVLSISSATALGGMTQNYTSVSGTPDSWSQTGVNYNWVTVPASISPIKLSPTSDIGYSGPWWNLNIGGVLL